MYFLIGAKNVNSQVTYSVVTFGCQQNVADSERIASMLEARGMVKASSVETAEHVVINTCMIRQMAENRVYGLVNNLAKQKLVNGLPKKIVVTGCMVGMAARDKTGKFITLIKKRMPAVDEFLPIEEVGFDHAPLRTDTTHAWVPISNGCNNFCTFCVVPFTRGREISRPYTDIFHECYDLARQGYTKITLLGMNVNSYGADLIVGTENVQVMRDIDKTYFDKSKVKSLPAQAGQKSKVQVKSQTKESNLQPTTYNLQQKGYQLPDGRIIKPVYVKHLNRLRIPTLFPYLLEDICSIDGIESIDFMSSNPWDFSDELIDVIARNPKISRSLHFAVQSGSDSVLKRMNRWYTKNDFLALTGRLRQRIPEIRFSTDIIVGFCGETDEEFADTVDLANKAGFYKAYVAMYSDRPQTAAHKAFVDDVPHEIKKQRWQVLEDLINKPNLARH